MAGSADPSRNKDDASDSENDEDFVPTEEKDDQDEDGDVAMHDASNSLPRLSAAKRKAVDDAFERLFGYPFGTSFRPKRRKKNESDYEVSKTQRILMDIFGATTAAQLLATSESVRNMERKPVVLPSLEETTVTEVKRFAGRDIVLQKTVPVEQKPADRKKNKAKAAAPKKTGGLDRVLEEMAGPSKISTVQKTSADWDAFKKDTEMEEELEKQAQGSKAYLVKKDFLQRVDERRFEKEKAQRDQQRASRK